MSGTKPTARLNRQFPARWIDVAADAGTAHALARSILIRRRYRADAALSGGVQFYEFSSPLLEFLDDIFSVGFLISLFRGGPSGYGKVAVWTEAVDGGTRLTVSLVAGHYHSTSVHGVIAELVDSAAAAGLLIQAGEPFSGIDLSTDSPGQPVPGYRRRQERKASRAARQA